MAIVYNQHFNRSVVIPWLDVLTLDEMSITPSLELHLGSGRLFGDTTLPGHKGQATHAFVFMLAGAMTRWKQVVAYHYSGNYTDGTVYRPIILTILEAAASIGLHVVNITTDMGSPNRAMWKSFGVTYAKPWIEHPVEPHQRLYFMVDVPHVVKNLKSALVNGHVITIPQDVVDKEKLPSSQVSVGPLKDISLISIYLYIYVTSPILSCLLSQQQE